MLTCYLVNVCSTDVLLHLCAHRLLEARKIAFCVGIRINARCELPESLLSLDLGATVTFEGFLFWYNANLSSLVRTDLRYSMES